MSYARRRLAQDSKYELEVTDGVVMIYRNGQKWLGGTELVGSKAWIEVADLYERLEEQAQKFRDAAQRIEDAANAMEQELGPDAPSEPFREARNTARTVRQFAEVLDGLLRGERP